MAKSGIIIHKGIQQVFTSGAPGTKVSGYDINGNVVLGVPVNTSFDQSFPNTNGATLSTNSNTYTRNFYDSNHCAPDCNTPILSSVTPNCSTNVFTILSTNVNTAISPSTRIEISTNNSFSTILGSSTKSNVNGSNSYTFDLSSYSIIPGSDIYFRLINLCGSGGSVESNPSNIISAKCIGCCAPSFTLGPVQPDFFGFTTVIATIDLGACSSIITKIAVETSTDGGITWDRVLVDKTTTYSLAAYLSYKVRMQSICGSTSSPYSTIYDYIYVAPPPATPNYSINGPFDTSELACSNNTSGFTLGLSKIEPDLSVGSRVGDNDILGSGLVYKSVAGWYVINGIVSGTPIQLNSSGYIVEIGTCGVIIGGETGTGVNPGSGFSGGKIICDLLYHQGYLPKEIWEADQKFGKLMLRKNKKGLFGYLTWAKPVVKFLTKNPQYSKYFYLITKPWSEHMAYMMGVLPEDNKLGKVIHYLGNKFSLVVYELVTTRRKRRKK
jgi:hypothetical protein